MNSSMPPVLASYVQQCLDDPSLTTLTSVLDTPTNWLLTRFFITALQKSNHGNSAAAAQSSVPTANNYKVIFVSIFRSFDIWSELAKKCGVNLHDAMASSKLCYIDGLAIGGNRLTGAMPLENLTLKDLDLCLTSAIKALAAEDPPSKILVIIDGIDFLLACQAKTSSHDIEQMLLELQSRVHGVIITCAADSALLHSTEAFATPLELEHTTLARGLAYQATWLFQLRPLETGQSKDVSGSIRISKGGAWESTEGMRDLDEGEWLFHFRNEGSVKVWSRGEA